MDDVALERKALTLFEAMLDIDDKIREKWLTEQTGSNVKLRQRVTQIWRADKAATMQTGAAVDAVEPLPPPDSIGAYKITGTIGSGGMGTVYAAERDEGDFEHAVAIKLIKPGILSERLVARFNHERQILARLNHPNITRLFDGGTTRDGQPYIVMERVDGTALLSWLAAGEPDEEARLRLLLQVCDAAAHAHRNLIVHRDLTPANVLVDAEGQAKLIDFGIARPDGEEVISDSAKIPLTAMTLTPGYAAPERLAGDASTVQSDIYSVGHMLAEMIDAPRAPELDAIIAKATADNADDRYPAMERLAEDIRLYLDGRPVEAMPGSTFYRVQKWGLRNTALAGAIGALVVATIAGAGATGWWWSQAAEARDQAEARFDEVRGIANFMLFELYDELEPVSGNTKALSHIADESKAYLERLSAGDNLDPDLRLEIARGYHRLSTVSGNPEGANLGRREDARQFLDRALADLDELHREEPGRADITEALASALYSEAIFKFIAEDDNEGSIAPAERSASLYSALIDKDPQSADYRFAWYRSRLQAAKPFVWIDKGPEGEARILKLIEELEADRVLAKQKEDFEIALASLYSELGYTRSWFLEVGKEDYARSLPPMDRAFAIYDRLFREAPAGKRDDRRLNLIATLFKRSLIHSDMEQPQKALADLELAERYANFIINRDPDDEGAKSRLDTLHSQKLFVLLDLGRNAEAIALARQSLAKREQALANEPDNLGYLRDVATGQQGLADTLDEAGQSAAACAANLAALDIWEEVAKRSEISSVDRENSLVPLEKAKARCRS
ncbi:serine/threonine-protein kinase [Pontixanthobacter aquaemixtae]|uniref:Protein kinase n=1 Tax=Pontixanthobacter aquaemixtae TaxID=1958940 RepID=A0A844ZZ01_9SPHN|nr:serine/threonine-protein kinase [Pontixanthobacter aquaemixtae]MXO91967.1 protein kinase [Pontixanthobacter aquaemixtae]